MMERTAAKTPAKPVGRGVVTMVISTCVEQAVVAVPRRDCR